MVDSNSTAAIALLLVALCGGDAAWGVDCTSIEDTEARACCERILPEHTMRQEISMAVVDDQGTIRDFAAELAWKRFDDGRVRARIDLTAPPRDHGKIVLLTEREQKEASEFREPEVVLYQPRERRDRLLSVTALSGDLLGTDFSYEDFSHFYGTTSDNDIQRLEDTTLDERAVMVLQSTPRDPQAAYDRGSTYSRIVSYIDREQCVPLKTLFFEDQDEPVKALIAKRERIQQSGGRWVPYEMVMHDHDDGSRTILTIEGIEFDPEIRDSFFSRSSLKRGR
ncbi:MAG: outer membrane lipoprotein-sorting protein [Proteobacteria bacterium]|nr:outer membrane lipoprotein-sorting protein [Pseudomonadota bacterium]